MEKEQINGSHHGTEGDYRLHGNRRSRASTWNGPERRVGEERRGGSTRRSGGIPRTARAQSRMAVSLPIALLNDVEKLAKQDVRSINGEIIVLLREAIDIRKVQ